MDRSVEERREIALGLAIQATGARGLQAAQLVGIAREFEAYLKGGKPPKKEEGEPAGVFTSHAFDDDGKELA